MKVIIALFVLFAVALATSVATLSEDEMRQLFVKFMHKHERFYGSIEEYNKRYSIFKVNVEKARLITSLSTESEAQYGVTKFSDLTEEEFRNSYLMRRPINREAIAKDMPTVTNFKMPNPIPDTWNWVEKGAVTPVKNQGACGSCWAFSTTGNVEGQWFLKTGKLVSLSEQNLVDCDHECDPKNPQDCDAGCNGGLMWNAFTYIIKNKGIDTESSYPYEGYNDKCRFNPANVGANISKWQMLPTNETELAAWLVSNGPIAIAINAEWLQFYIGGVSDPLMCNPKGLDHGVLIVGFGTGKTILGREVPYWLIKNSWGSGWGEKGYFRIIRGKGKCGLNTAACTSAV